MRLLIGRTRTESEGETKMRVIAGFMLATALLATGTEFNSAAAAEPDKVQLAIWIQNSGLHCPTVVSIEKTSEDATGVTQKITCVSTDGKSSWFIRGLFTENFASRGSLNDFAQKFSPWEATPPQWTTCRVQRVSSMIDPTAERRSVAVVFDPG